MKLLCFVDTHGNKKYINKVIKKSKEADIIICAGDLTNWGVNIKGLIEKLNRLNKLTLIIPGNHETPQEIEKYSKDNVINLHKKAYIINDYIFLGFGGSGFTLIDKDFEKVAKNFERTIKKDSKIILIVHAPPFNTRLDKLPLAGHHGNKSISNFIKKIQPNLVVCGHFHENVNKQDKIKNSLIINPGSLGKIIEI